jgi:hypothetical protein
MTLRFADLPPDEGDTLAFLDDGLPFADSVGRRVGELRGRRLAAADALIGLGLAEMTIGPNLAGGFYAWVRLTPLGRRLRAEARMDGAGDTATFKDR